MRRDAVEDGKKRKTNMTSETRMSVTRERTLNEIYISIYAAAGPK
jgi:hypothetical protein